MQPQALYVCLKLPTENPSPATFLRIHVVWSA
jgi:hypothetical protein